MNPDENDVKTNDLPSGKKPLITIAPKSAGIIGVATIVVGNLTSLLGAVRSLNEQVQRIQQQLHLDAAPYALYIVGILIAAGYLLYFTSLYAWLKTKLRATDRFRSVAVAALLVGCAVAAAAANFAVIHRSDSTTFLEGRLPLWRDKLLHASNRDGGITVLLEPGLSNPTQVFVTAQAVVAVESSMLWDNPKQNEIDAIRNALAYFSSKRNPSGGWGYFDNSQPLAEVSGWVIIARVKAIAHADKLWNDQADQDAQLGELDQDLAALMLHYDQTSAAWSPFPIKKADSTTKTTPSPCESTPADLAGVYSQPPTRTYSTIIAVWALLEADSVPAVRQHLKGRYTQELNVGLGTLLGQYQTTLHGWVPNANRSVQREDYLGLTAQTIAILYSASTHDQLRNIFDQPRWTQIRQDFARRTVAHQLIGDNGHLSDFDAYVFPYPQPLEPMTFLWSPWSALAFKLISEDTTLDKADREHAEQSFAVIVGKYTPEFLENLESEQTYELSENLYGFSTALLKHPQL